MVKLDEIPMEERERINLDDLPETNTLKAVNEYFLPETEDKTGGLAITFEQKDGKIFTQKYAKISGRKMVKALEKLGIKDTEELQEIWCEYRLTPMRSGYPRYIPISKAKVVK